MATRVECVHTTNRSSPHERIRNIGGTNGTGRGWRVSQARAIERIESGREAFYVERPAGDRAKLVVAVSPSGDKYLKTEADGDEPSTLLSLPECP